jgi:lysophospholipase L1-like esterase
MPVDDSNAEKAVTRKPGRLKRVAQNLALFAAVFLLCALVVELGLRVAGYGNLEIYQPDRRLYWRLKPDQHCFTKVDRRAVAINSHGTRGAEFVAKKPPGTVRILSLGDSRTFGWGLEERETYSAELGRLLEERLRREATTRNLPSSTPGQVRVEVINGGVNAWSFQQMLVFYREFAAAWQPDYVLVGEANLWTQFSEQNSAEFAEKFMTRVRLKNFLRRFALYHYVVEVKLNDFYARHRTKFIPVDPRHDTLFKEQQRSDPNAAFREAIEGICNVARTNGAQPVLLILPRLDELGATNEMPIRVIKQEIAARLGVLLADAAPEIAPGGKALYLDADPVHFNAEGNAIIARKIFAKLRPVP